MGFDLHRAGSPAKEKLNEDRGASAWHAVALPPRNGGVGLLRDHLLLLSNLRLTCIPHFLPYFLPTLGRRPIIC